MGDGGRWLIRYPYQPINCGLLIKLVKGETHPYAPLLLLSNHSWVREVPICNVPFIELSLEF